jgi:hypothetical protein
VTEPPETSWGSLAAALAEALSHVELSLHLQIFEAVSDEQPRYVQAFQAETWLAAEAAAVSMQPPEPRLPDASERRIGELGWRPPELDWQQRGTSPNWRFELAWPAPAAAYRRLGEDIVTIWRDVFGLASPAQLRYRAFRAGPRAPTVVPLPELGLAWGERLSAWMALQPG